MKILRRYGLPLLLACLICNTASAAVRFSFPLKDLAGKIYAVQISAADEILDHPQPYCAYGEGDTRAAGHYQAWLLPPGAKRPVLQPTALFATKDGSGEFNLNRRLAYVIRGRKSEPDLLVHVRDIIGGDAIFLTSPGRLTSADAQGQEQLTRYITSGKGNQENKR
jgi:hypothetical protein